MKSITFKKGMLVQPTLAVESVYSGYGERPTIVFKPHMLGVVREDNPLLGVQVEYIAPETGCIELVRINAQYLNIINWPGSCVDLSTVVPAEVGDVSDYWFCDAITYLGVVQLIKAIATLSYDYLDSIGINTIRVPGVHTCKIRSQEPVPEVTMPARKQIIDSELEQVLAIV